MIPVVPAFHVVQGDEGRGRSVQIPMYVDATI